MLSERAALVQDADALFPRLPPLDRLEWSVASRGSPVSAMRYAIASSPGARTFVGPSGAVELIYGAYDNQACDYIAPWLVARAGIIQKHWRRFLRESRDRLNALHWEAHMGRPQGCQVRVVAPVTAIDRIRWLTWLGLEPVASVPFGPLNAPHLLFVRERP